MVQLEGTSGSAPANVIRLRVGYDSVQSLVKEYTASLGRGGCLLVTRKAVEPGACFLFEMSCEGVEERLVVEGEVVRVRAISAPSPAFELAVRYRASAATRAALDVMLAAIGVDTSYAIVREAPRIPVNLPAGDSRGELRYYVRDVSAGGMRIECVRGTCQVVLGDRVLIGIRQTSGPKVFVTGTVRWSRHVTRSGELQFGVRFDELSDEQDPRRQAIDGLVQLRRPAQVFVHIVDFKSRQASRMKGSRELRRVEPAEVRAAVTDLAQRELAERFGLEVVDSPIDHLLGEDSALGRASLAGDLTGEIRVHASSSLCSAVAEQVGGAEVPCNEALQKVVERFGRSLCLELAKSGFEVTSGQQQGESAEARAGDVVHTTFLAGERGLAALRVIARVP